MSLRTAQVPGFGWRIPTLVGLLVLALTGCVAGFFVSSFLHQRKAEEAHARLSLLNQQERHALSIFRQAARARSGIESAFAALRHARTATPPVMGALGEIFEGAGARDRLRPLEQEWAGLIEAIDLILAAQEPILGLRESLETLQTLSRRLELHASMLLEGAPGWDFEPGQFYAVSNLRLMSARLSANLRRSLDATGTLIDSEQYGQDAKLLAAMGDAITGLTLGDPPLGIVRVGSPKARRMLEGLAQSYREGSDILRAIVSNTLVVIHVRETSETMAASAERVPILSADLRNGGSAVVLGDPWAEEKVRFGAAAGAIVIIVLLVLTIVLTARARVAAERRWADAARVKQDEAIEVNRRSQGAILQLLDEISVLADGDLSAQASVSEDITGAIADAVNYAIEALREIVANINDTSAEVRSAANQSRIRAAGLTDASRAQVQQIAQASDALHQMSRSVERIAQEASKSSQVAAQSVDIANRGAAAVGNTIGGMDAIRETMQETAKRLKRLGESSQEIGDIVSLIDDVADQTNVLALNAAIQASTASDSGRGFAVVADEVQRLAERAGQATKRIEALVRAIQTDTHEAVASMEQSTAGVVSGARIAARAGEALTEIETVSQRLAARTDEITSLSRDHSVQAGEIASVMEAILEATTQTQTGTEDTTRSIGELAELADALRESVGGFKLPERDFSSTVTLPQQIAARRAAAGRVQGRPNNRLEGAAQIGSAAIFDAAETKA